MANSPAGFYRPVAKKLAQGDIALAEVVQVKARSGDREDPHGVASAAPDIPFVGEPVDYPLSYDGATGQQSRLIRVWPTAVMVLHQTCEIEFAANSDSRLIVAPIATASGWPEGPWGLIRRNVLPGYFYLPSLSVDEAANAGLPDAWGEAVVVLATASLSSVGVIKRRRIVSLSIDAASSLQDSLSRFYGVRGFADLASFDEVIGRPIRRVVETGLTISAPSRVVKVYFGGDEMGDDDERSYSYWGVRQPLERTS